MPSEQFIAQLTSDGKDPPEQLISEGKDVAAPRGRSSSQSTLLATRGAAEAARGKPFRREAAAAKSGDAASRRAFVRRWSLLTQAAVLLRVSVSTNFF